MDFEPQTQKQDARPEGAEASEPQTKRPTDTAHMNSSPIETQAMELDDILALYGNDDCHVPKRYLIGRMKS